QEEFLVLVGIVVERAVDLVAARLVERPRLERMGVELDRMGAALAGIGFGLVHQPGAPVLAAHRRVDPEISDVHPAAPDRAEQPAHRLAARVLHEQVHGVVGRFAGDADIVDVEAIDDEAGLGAALLLEHDLQVGCHGAVVLRQTPACGNYPNCAKLAAMRRRLLLQGAATLPLAAAADGHAQGVKSQDISAGRVSGVFVAPARVPAPAIFVLHTAWGRVHSADIAYAKALAGAGFVAFAINYPGKGKPTWVPEYLGWMVR